MAANIRNNAGAHLFKYTVSGAIANGSLQIVGATPMVALEAATASGQTITMAVGVEATLPKATGAGTDWAIGGRVFYVDDAGTKKLTGAAGDGTLIGYGAVAAGVNDTTGVVRLITGPIVLETQA